MSPATDYDPDNCERKTLGLIKTLGRHPEVCDIKMTQNLPVSKSQLSLWEQKHFCKIPDDLRNFYHVMDGLSMTWNVTVNGINVPVGMLTINPIDQMVKLTIGVAGAQIAHLHLNDDDSDGDKDQNPTNSSGMVSVVQNLTKVVAFLNLIHVMAFKKCAFTRTQNPELKLRKPRSGSLIVLSDGSFCPNLSSFKQEIFL